MSNDYEQWYFLKVQLCAKFPSQRSELYIIYRTSLIIGCNNAKEQYYDIYIYIFIFIYLFLKTNKLCFEIPSLCYMYFCYFKNQVINV